MLEADIPKTRKPNCGAQGMREARAPAIFYPVNWPVTSGLLWTWEWETQEHVPRAHGMNLQVVKDSGNIWERQLRWGPKDQLQTPLTEPKTLSKGPPIHINSHIYIYVYTNPQNYLIYQA